MGNLAKHPSSTVQILGAEKALFRALKTKHDTPKYGLIYHASLVGQTNPKNKGKVSRMLAAKASLAISVDALGEGDATSELGMEHRAKLEGRLRALEEGYSRKLGGSGKKKSQWDKYEDKSEVKTYNASGDSSLPKVPKKRKFEEENGEEASASPVKKKSKKEQQTPKIKSEPTEDSETPVKKKKKKKNKEKGEGDADTTMDTTANDTLDTSTADVA